jgi:hypothetical protein
VAKSAPDIQFKGQSLQPASAKRGSWTILILPKPARFSKAVQMSDRFSFGCVEFVETEILAHR